MTTVGDGDTTDPGVDIAGDPSVQKGREADRAGSALEGIPMRVTRSNIVAAIAVLILVAAVPSAVRDTIETGRIYLFSWQFVEELPKRFTGPGRFRFILQPSLAILIGLRGGIADARAGRLPYLYGLLTGGRDRKELVRSGWVAIRDLVAMGIVLDAVAQLLIYRQVHPGAALVIGPVLICTPYAVMRALSNRAARYFLRVSTK